MGKGARIWNMEGILSDVILFDDNPGEVADSATWHVKLRGSEPVLTSGYRAVPLFFIYFRIYLLLYSSFYFG